VTREAVDLNADVGEGMGDDAGLLAIVTSANVACGGHAGDPQTMDATIKIALERGVAVGAHPSYPGQEHFGRQSVKLAPETLERELLVQLDLLASIARASGAVLHHVKPHGALYNDAAKDKRLAATVATAIARFDPRLILVGLARSALLEAGEAAGLRVAGEGFCDRAYEPDGSLRPRSLPHAVYDDPRTAASQALSLVERADIETLCIHGDSPHALTMAKAVRTALEEAGIAVRKL